MDNKIFYVWETYGEICNSSNFPFSYIDQLLPNPDITLDLLTDVLPLFHFQATAGQDHMVVGESLYSMKTRSFFNISKALTVCSIRKFYLDTAILMTIQQSPYTNCHHDRQGFEKTLEFQLVLNLTLTLVYVYDVFLMTFLGLAH